MIFTHAGLSMLVNVIKVPGVQLFSLLSCRIKYSPVSSGVPRPQAKDVKWQQKIHRFFQF